MLSSSASSAANARASFTTSSIEIPDRGTNGITSAAPIRGWPPVCFVMSISSTALAAPASALARTASGEPTTVVSRRLCSGSACRWTSRASPAARASQIASITSRRRPSLKFGTQTTRAPVSAIEAEAYDAGDGSRRVPGLAPALLRRMGLERPRRGLGAVRRGRRVLVRSLPRGDARARGDRPGLGGGRGPDRAADRRRAYRGGGGPGRGALARVLPGRRGLDGRGGRDPGLRLRRRRSVRPAQGVVRPPRNTFLSSAKTSANTTLVVPGDLPQNLGLTRVGGRA